MDLPDTLLALAAASTWDGGDEVVRVARAALQEVASYDAGEIAVAGTLGFDRWTLTDDAEPIAAEDLLHEVGRGTPLRFDDLHEAEAFPRTQERMEARGFRSLVALPFLAAGGAEGGIVLARAPGWGFVAAPAHALQAVVGMTGLALERAVALTALRRKIEALDARVRVLGGEVEAARRETRAAREDAEAARRRAEQAEARLREAERALARPPLKPR